jgi:hypothetical protein
VDKKLEITPVTNQSFSESFKAEGPPTIYTLQEPFMLTEAQFHALRSDATALSNIVHNLVAALIVLSATIAIRWVYGLAKPGSPELGWIDVFTLGALVLVTLALWVANYKWPGRRAEIVRSIQLHFEENKPLFGSGKTHGRSSR